MGISDPRDYLGAIIAGKYVIDRLIGAGGFAWVYHAKTITRREVAVKILHASGKNAIARFDREVEVLKALPANPFVAGFLNRGLTIDGRPYLSLDFVDGITLLQAMQRREHMDPRYCAAFMAELCEAFTELHRLGVAHRDVKPENILLAQDGSIKLIDFGLIRDAQGILELLEQDDPVDRRVFAKELDHRTLVGTPEYMAPEQFSDAIVSDIESVRTDTWSDVFSLGVILFELIAGVMPLPMENTSLTDPSDKEIYKYMRWRINLTDGEVPRCPGVDAALDSILQKCLRHDPRQRQPDARALKGDLLRYVTTGKGVSRSLASNTLAVNVSELESEELTIALAEAAKAAENPGQSSDAIGVARDAIAPEDSSQSESSSRRYIPSDTISDGGPPASMNEHMPQDDRNQTTDTHWLERPVPLDDSPLRDMFWDINDEPTGETFREPPLNARPSDSIPTAVFSRDQLKSVVQEALAVLIETESVSAEITEPFEPLSPDEFEGGPQGR